MYNMVKLLQQEKLPLNLKIQLFLLVTKKSQATKESVDFQNGYEVLKRNAQDIKSTYVHCC